jgi:thiosulfate reductase cytochrome b subunit
MIKLQLKSYIGIIILIVLFIITSLVMNAKVQAHNKIDGVFLTEIIISS